MFYTILDPRTGRCRITVTMIHATKEADML